MTVQTNERTTSAAPSCHGHGSAGAHVQAAHALPAGRHREGGTGAVALGAILALPRAVRLIGGAAIVLGSLLAAGVPLATLTPLVALGGCLGMHLFMGHGMNHGGGHGSHEVAGLGAGAGAEEASPRRNG